MQHPLRSWLTVSSALVALTMPWVLCAQELAEPDAASAPSEVPIEPEATVVAPGAAPSVASSEGAVSYYGREFAGRPTSSGERFDPGLLTMAHRTLPFGTLVRVTNLFNAKSVVVRVNDRGPFTGGRIGDVSTAAAMMLDMLRAGVVRARLEVLGTGGRGHKNN